MEPPTQPHVQPTGPAPSLARRLVQLYAGLALYGLSMALLVRSELGVMPWDVLHQGLARRTGLSLGTVTIAVGALVLLAWIPLRQRPGVGTVSNVLVIGVAVDAALLVVPVTSSLPVQVVLLLTGVLLNGVATAAYIGVRLGPGPRDGLMTGLVRVTGRSTRLVRTTIETAVVATGWVMGGTVGAGTVLYALAIGPLVHPLLPRFDVGQGAERSLRAADWWGGARRRRRRGGRRRPAGRRRTGDAAAAQRPAVGPGRG